MSQPLFPNVQKLAVFRATALGDLIFALPALEALRCAYPQAELVYLGREWHTGFLPGRLRGPHRVIAVPPAATKEQIEQGLVIDPAQEESFLRAMQAEHFDLALQMHGGGEYSNPFVLNLQARHSAGLKSPRAIALERWMPYVYYQNEVARMLEVASLAGAGPAESLQPRLCVLEADLQAAEPVLEALHRPFVVIHPGSTDPRRCWSPEKFAALADACAAEGLQVVLTGTQMDTERIQAVKDSMRAPALDLCCHLSLPGLIGLLSQADLFAGNDSGPLHLALALGARAIGVFWVEYMLNSLPMLRENFFPLIAWQRTCPRCGRLLDKDEADHPLGSCKHDISMLEEIPASSAITGIEQLLAQPRRPALFGHTAASSD